MITADPNLLRYGAGRFAAAAQEMQRQSMLLEQTTTSVRQGADGWSGEGSQSFLLRGERLAADAKTASSAFESVAQTLIRFAMRMEQVLELRRRADRLDQQAFEYGDDTLDSIHTRQHLRHQAAQLRHQANAEASHADAQTSSEFQTIARMIPPSLIPGAEADAPDALLAGLPKHWQDYYSRHPELLAEEKVAPPLTADQIEAHRRAHAMTILILYHTESQSLWLPDEDRTEAARVYCDQAYGKLSADDLENEIELIRAEEERNYLWQERIQNGAHGKELIEQEGYKEYAIKQYYQDGAFLGMAAAIAAAGGFKRSKGIPSIPSLAKDQVTVKPKNSPDPVKWMKKGGSITIDEDGTWTYHDWEGNSVRYPNGYPDFKEAGMVKQEVQLDNFESYSKDFSKADELAPHGPMNKEVNTWHHHQDGTTMQEVNKKLHRRFTHIGGMSDVRKK